MAPELALARGQWVKLICGASNHDLAAIEDLCALYGLVGVDCIDVAADPAAVAAAAAACTMIAQVCSANAESPCRAPLAPVDLRSVGAFLLSGCAPVELGSSRALLL